jgi:serine phosphatase RsbU (regulator of sigma subunit)
MTQNTDLTLRRLLDRTEVAVLVQDFAADLPTGCDLAVFDASGRFFAGTGTWPAVEPAAAQDAARVAPAAGAPGGGPGNAEVALYPLLAGSHYLGALAVRGPVPEGGPRGLHRSLNMLLEQAADRREIAAETLDRYREINLLYHLGETFGACLDAGLIPELALMEARRAVRADAGLALVAGQQAGGQMTVAAAFGGATDDAVSWRNAAQELIDRVAASGCADIAVLNGGGRLPPASALCAPLKGQERTIGVTLLGRAAGQPVFAASDLKLLSALTDQAGLALERAWLHEREVRRQRFEEELALGRRIQLSLLPQACPHIPGLDIAAAYRAADEVGGDYYDFLPLPHKPDQWGLVIADVTGKGVPAALMMAHSRAIIRTETLNGRGPAAVLERTNRSLIADTFAGLFLSAFFATLDTLSGRLTFASGGHDHPLWLSAASGECRELVARGIVLGAFHDITLEEVTIDVEPGDALVFYTDGVTDMRNAQHEMFELARLQEVVTANAAAPAGDIVAAVVDALREFAGDTPAPDDFTLFVVKRCPSTA